MLAPKNLEVPHIGEENPPAIVTRILVKEGDVVERDTAIVELETDKVTLELPADCPATVLKINVTKGQKVKAGDSICLLLPNKSILAENTVEVINELNEENKELKQFYLQLIEAIRAPYDITPSDLINLIKSKVDLSEMPKID